MCEIKHDRNKKTSITTTESNTFDIKHVRDKTCSKSNIPRNKCLCPRNTCLCPRVTCLCPRNTCRCPSDTCYVPETHVHVPVTHVYVQEINLSFQDQIFSRSNMLEINNVRDQT